MTRARRRSGVLIVCLLACSLGASSRSPAQAPTVMAWQPRPPEQVTASRRVWAYLDGQRRAMDLDDARRLGFTIVDLSDDWAPIIFWPQTPGERDSKPNEYLDDYIALANDRIDLDGARLRRGRQNHLEVYGIPPSLGVLRQRWLEDEAKPCFAALDPTVFHDYQGPVRVVDEAGSARLQQQYQQARAAFVAAQRASGTRNLERLLLDPTYRRTAATYKRLQWQRRALTAMHQRLACEGLYEGRVPQVAPGQVTWAVREALRRFERKHNVYGAGMIHEDTAQALGRSARENNFEALKRVITERAVSAAGVVEDGTVTASYRGADGKTQRVQDLVSQVAQATLKALGLTDALRGLEFVREPGREGFTRLLVGVRLPTLPEYHTRAMDLSVVIDRGDVWYDLPFDERGGRLAQPRSRLPAVTVFTRYRDQLIPLVRWRTTIGSWQKEMRGNEEYYKYKVSDVGSRVWKHVVAGPVWVPPKVTPGRELIKAGGSGLRVAQSAFGPGYASAYGLVAAFHVTAAGADNQVRTHGTVNYMSVFSGFSHGCHRLRNFQAVRLFSFVLRHRNFKRIGQLRLAYTHRFEHRGEEFQINLHTRGYYYELTPPLPVNVLEGTIRGTLKQPIEEYVKKPSQVYQDELPPAGGRPKGPSGAPRGHDAPHSHMQQQQAL
ncbi:MAG: hypothetical protein IPL40_06045 [Proteobacteria bacterium]|nr:hypothetical protein [Pseudomonadota bacterium]